MKKSGIINHVREKCIRKALFHFFIGTKAHWKQTDPEGSTRVLSCRKILLEESCGERPSSFDPSARLSKVQSRNLELITSLLYCFGQLCCVSQVGFGSVYFGGRICLRCISWEVLAGAPGASCPPAMALRTHYSSGPLAGQPVDPMGSQRHDSHAAHPQISTVWVSAQFRVISSAFISFNNYGSWLLLLHFEGFVPKVMGNLTQLLIF